MVKIRVRSTLLDAWSVQVVDLDLNDKIFTYLANLDQEWDGLYLQGDQKYEFARDMGFTDEQVEHVSMGFNLVVEVDTFMFMTWVGYNAADDLKLE
jgi:hypothetical protein